MKNYLQVNRNNQQQKQSQMMAQKQQVKSNYASISKQCVECNKFVPNCSVCLAPIGIMNPYIEMLKNKVQMGGSLGAGSSLMSSLNPNQQQDSQMMFAPKLDIMMKRQLEMWFLWC